MKPTRPALRAMESAAEGRVPVEVITSGEYPGDGLPKPVAFPEPSGNVVVIDGIKTLHLERLVELKLASGMSAADRLKDLADVQELIKAKKLGEDFGRRLDQWVRDEYRKLHGGVEQALRRGSAGTGHDTAEEILDRINRAGQRQQRRGRSL